MRLLPNDLVDQIAAGEVVERPASVVKELVENAIDAGATSIRVETDQGGVARIVVTDDGVGMRPDDARLAMSRHATSKITSMDDLLAIRTLGFRGEALPSIASVSRFALRTRRHDADSEGFELRIAGGGPVEERVTGGAPGTTVSVDDLFFNIPARRKFLKSTATESANIGEVLARFALAYPGLRLVWIRDGRKAREWLAVRDGYQRALQLFPDEKLLAVEGERDGVRVRAMLSAPDRARAGATQLHVSVNGRIVRDRAIARAVAFAYGSALPAGRFPVGVVWLELDPERVDVNVHPQKSEVRLADGRVVLEAVTRVLASGLGSMPFRDAKPSARPPSVPSEDDDERFEDGDADAWALAGNDPRSDASSMPRNSAGSTYPMVDEAAPVVRERSPLERPVERSAVERSTVERSIAPNEPRPSHVASEPTPLGLRVLGQASRSFIVCEGADGIVFVDQHAADERVRFARLVLSRRAGAIEAQRLLIPERVELGEREASYVAEHAHVLASMGLDTRLLGERVAVVTSVPVLVGRAAPERLLRDVLAELVARGPRSEDEAIEAGLAAMACHAAVRSGDPLSIEEMRSLLDGLARVQDFTGHSPHGRPVVHTLPMDDLRRKVGR